MKKVIFGLIATVFMVNLSWGQVVSIGELLAPPTTIPIDKDTTPLKFNSRNANNSGFDLSIKNEKNKSYVLPNFRSNNSFELILADSNGKPIHSQIVSQKFWPIVIIAALCCVSAGTGSAGWYVEFKCDCLSSRNNNIIVTTVQVDDTSYPNVAGIYFKPITSK